MTTHQLKIRTSRYTDPSGAEKWRHETVGEIREGKYGPYILANPFLLLGLCTAAVARGEDKITMQMFDTCRWNDYDSSGAVCFVPNRQGGM